ncbi:unnamed protein product [Clonostachys rosea f. rosea IK726]|uniref:Uncharacterized protein n=1 Tax=Clonostachys rosea f. rosea IK726 TaxID=1349383 RepID=A0ACA9UEC0_BIOOC|nr:unnamed protein product [Clonostachys rosea f. rosea IK726]
MMADSLSSSLTSRIPLEVFNEIFSYLPRDALLALRALDRRLGAIATAHAFRHVHLGAQEDKDEHELLINVARSENLRHLVREVTCDTWVGSNFRYDANDSYPLPSEFLNALPYLRFFRNLSSLNVVFTQFCGHTFLDPYTSVEETTDFRYRVLDTVFRSVAGTWSSEQQANIDQTLQLRDFEPTYDQIAPGVSDAEIARRLPLKTLTISNLGDYNDERLTNSDYFKAVLESKELVDLKLQITTQADDAAPENELYLCDKYDLFAALPSTWLSPTVAGNLTTMSLYCREHWGWNPKMDFRAVRPGMGVDSGFPSLRVLALGKYVFSHEWQVDWIASLGCQNGRGGLEKLYLDNCPIMYYAHHLKPLDESTTVVGKDRNGDDIVVSNEGYHRRDVLARRPATQRGSGTTHGKREFPLQWHTVLSQWNESMTSLRVFKMGCGALTSPSVNVGHFLLNHGDMGRGHCTVHRQAFRYFDCLTPPPDDTPYEDIDDDKYASGVGLSQDRNRILQYAYFGGSDTCLVDRNRPRDRIPERENTDSVDELALEALYTTVKARRMRG